MAYARLREFLGLPSLPIRIYDPVQQLAIVDEDVLQRFQVDTIELGRAFALEESWWTDWELPDGTPCLIPVWAKPERDGGDWVIRSQSRAGCWRACQQVSFTSSKPIGRSPNTTTWISSQMCSMRACGPRSRLPPGPMAAGPDGAKILGRGAQRLRSQTDRAILGLFGGNLLEARPIPVSKRQFLPAAGGQSGASASVSGQSPSRCTWRTWSGFSPRSDPTSTSLCLATISGCKKDRRFPLVCTANSFSRGKKRCGPCPGTGAAHQDHAPLLRRRP